jgi:aminoglycoside phosphotransferase (APT) family kinase protein
LEAQRAVRETGEVLARLQSFSFETPGFFGETMDVATPWPSGRHEIVGLMERCLFNDVAGDRLGDDLTQRAWSYVRQNQDSLCSIEQHAMLVHGDFNGFNVIVSRSGVPRVAALIDWEYAHAGTPLLDLASMLRRPGRNLPTWFEQELLRGYRMAGGVLPSDWKRAAQVVDVVRLCTFVRSPNVGEFAVDGVRALVESALADASGPKGQPSNGVPRMR